mmetsp:Transcript_24828/g.46370  ORF Transcript_24828/g.46370 Transcript_24828/m.46370 type:complete len:114 (-) Transcript_24828:282-623(-)
MHIYLPDNKLSTRQTTMHEWGGRFVEVFLEDVGVLLEFWMETLFGTFAQLVPCPGVVRHPFELAKVLVECPELLVSLDELAAAQVERRLVVGHHERGGGFAGVFLEFAVHVLL